MENPTPATDLNIRTADKELLMNYETKSYRVQYQEEGTQGRNVTGPMHRTEALQKVAELEQQGLVSDIKIIPADEVVEDEFQVLYIDDGQEKSTKPEPLEDARTRAKRLAYEGHHVLAILLTQDAKERRENVFLEGFDEKNILAAFRTAPANVLEKSSFATDQMRHTALEMAVRVVEAKSTPRIDMAPGDAVLDYAKRFMGFLRGDEDRA